MERFKQGPTLSNVAPIPALVCARDSAMTSLSPTHPEYKDVLVVVEEEERAEELGGGEGEEEEEEMDVALTRGLPLAPLEDPPLLPPPPSSPPSPSPTASICP